MRLFPDLPIRQKLTVIILLSNVVALLLAGVATVVYKTSLFRHAAVREASFQARLLATTCASALARNSLEDARARLAALQSQPQIASAQLFTESGALFADYPAGRAAPLPKGTSFEEGYHIESGHVLSVKPLLFNSRPVGTLVLRTRTDELEQHLQVGLWAIAGALALSTLIALVFSWQLQRSVSHPIRELAHVVTSVGACQDYSLRAVKSNNDEIGALTEGVNRMLDRIQRHDKELHESEELFRQVTESISEVFWMTDVAKNKMIYVSPGYDKIWGRTCARLYESPWEWLEAIHPDDRERVRKASLSKQTIGTYDEEYRIVRPDGSIRWIRDRAFRVFDNNGKLYRLAGIAEDMTEQKRLEREVMEISDREQERIGQDLHDGLCQHLASIAMTAGLLKRRLTGVSNPEARIADRVCSQLEDAIAQARGVARGVSTLDLADDNLSPALQALASATEKEYGITCQVDFAQPICFGDPAIVMNIYRIAREAVYNAAKHARPTRIMVALKAQGDGVHLIVTDDGVGIGNPPKNGLGMGLGMMKYRASMIGAELRIERAPEGGTVMTCNLPRNPL
jgi:PAS domain S-box-containing protein